MAKLPTSNLKVSQILTKLGASSPKGIFYNGGSLKSLTKLGEMVNKNGLSDYCPGATPDDKLNNLLNHRKLSYFKGYNPVTRIYIYNNGVMDGNFTLYHQSYGSFGEEQFYSFQANHISISRDLANSSGGTATLYFESSKNYSYPVGSKVYMVYDLSTSQGNIVLARWGAKNRTNPNESITDFPASANGALIGGNSECLTACVSKCELVIRSNSAVFTMKIREIYLEYS